MKIRPLHDRVIVKRVEAERTTSSGIVIPDSAGEKPDQGEVLVTGATGGVGSIAVALLARAGFTVAAATGKAAEADYLAQLGAASVIDPLTRPAEAGLVSPDGRTALIPVQLTATSDADALATTA